MTSLINLYGSPGSGKSTIAAWLFAKMKRKRINVELVTEVAKDLVWEGNRCRLDNQLYILGEQSTRLLRLRNKVDVIISDSPMLMQLYYGQDLPKDAFTDLILFVEQKFKCFDVWVNRACEFDPVGRIQSCSEEADEVGEQIKVLVEEVIDFTEKVQGNKAGAKALWKAIKNDVL